MATVYMIRGQGSGIHTDKVFFRHPTDEELEAALKEELEKFGVSPDGSTQKLWVRVLSLESIGDARDLGSTPSKDAQKVLEGELTPEQVKAHGLERSTTGAVQGATGNVAFAGQGTVTPPPGSHETITEDDVGAIDVSFLKS